MLVRPLDRSELPAANRAWASVAFEPSTEEDVVIGAFIEGALVGLGRLVPLGEGALELGGIWVAPSHRRAGLARTVVTALVERAGAAQVYCLPFARLESFYATFGFRRVAAPPARLPPSLAAKLAAIAGRYDDEVIVMKLRVYTP